MSFLQRVSQQNNFFLSARRGWKGGVIFPVGRSTQTQNSRGMFNGVAHAMWVGVFFVYGTANASVVTWSTRFIGCVCVHACVCARAFRYRRQRRKPVALVLARYASQAIVEGRKPKQPTLSFPLPTFLFIPHPPSTPWTHLMSLLSTLRSPHTCAPRLHRVHARRRSSNAMRSSNATCHMWWAQAPLQRTRLEATFSLCLRF